MANEEKKKEKKREVLQLTLSVTTTYPPPPAIATQPLSPPPPSKTTAVADGMTDDDDFSSDEENTIDRQRSVTPEDETKQERNERVARNAKRAKKDDATAQQNANRSANIQQGRIPELVGVVQIDGTWERDDRFRGLLGIYSTMHPRMLYSPDELDEEYTNGRGAVGKDHILH